MADDNVPTQKGQAPRKRFVLTIEWDSASQASGYTVTMDDGFNLAIAANTLDKVKLRVLMDQLQIEGRQIAQHLASKIVPATTMPPEKIAGRVMQGRNS